VEALPELQPLLPDFAEVLESVITPVAEVAGTLPEIPTPLVSGLVEVIDPVLASVADVVETAPETARSFLRPMSDTRLNTPVDNLASTSSLSNPSAAGAEAGQGSYNPATTLDSASWVSQAWQLYGPAQAFEEAPASGAARLPWTSSAPAGQELPGNPPASDLKTTLSWLRAAFAVEQPGVGSAGALSAVLLSLFVLIISPALAAKANVALLAPRSPAFVPVYPPD
jgi:hypothetical protein